jgi:glucose-1-phosphate cytidylyltransferase
MQLVILAGGLGSRLSEETTVKPKPLVEIGGMPIIWHIMKIYEHYGVKDFIVCLGYKGYLIKEFFSNLRLHSSDITIKPNGEIIFYGSPSNDWSITLVETGPLTQTGGRLMRVRDYIKGDNFFMTYGDGLGDVDIKKLYQKHMDSACLATVTAARPLARFGALELDGDKVTAFVEKPVSEGGWINGGFFVLNKNALDYIRGDETLWEQEPMRNLAQDGQLIAFEHHGFWQPMDTQREKQFLESLWSSGKAPWKVWD